MSGDFTLDIYQGAPGSFRPWSRQFRQPIRLRTQSAVIERAPLAACLHITNQLDTLGLDRPDSECQSSRFARRCDQQDRSLQTLLDRTNIFPARWIVFADRKIERPEQL